MRAIFIALVTALGMGLFGTSPTLANSVTGNELARAAELGALADQARFHFRRHHHRHHLRHRHHRHHHHHHHYR
jgi:hypothetical protein